MRFLEGNPVIGSFSRKFRVQQAKKAKTKSIYTPPLGEKKQQVCVSPKKYFWQVSEGTETCYYLLRGPTPKCNFEKIGGITIFEI